MVGDSGGLSAAGQWPPGPVVVHLDEEKGRTLQGPLGGLRGAACLPDQEGAGSRRPQPRVFYPGR